MPDFPRAEDIEPSSLDIHETELRRLARRWLRVVRALFIAVAVLLWLAFLEDTSHEHRQTLRAVAERDANLATAIEHYAVRVLRTANAVHRLLGTYVAQGMDPPRLQPALADRLRANDVFDELGLCLPGDVVLAASRQQQRLDPAMCGRLAALAGHGPGLSILPVDAPHQGPRIALALPLRVPQGAVLAVALVKPDTLLGTMQSARLRADTVVLLSAADGTPRAAWNSQRGYVMQASEFAALRSVVSGRGYLVSSRSMEDGGLRIEVATSRDDALAGFRARRARLLIMSTLISLALAGVYVALERMHAKGLARAAALRDARAELELLNASLDQQVQQRTADLRRANEDLQTFSYAVAHDVRAPLASIAGFADAMAPGLQAAGDPKLLHYLKRIQSNASHLDALTGHLLELGRLAHAQLQPREVDLSGVAQDVVAQLREKEPARSVEVDIEPGLSAWGDPSMLRGILENLLGNAWKFTARRESAHIAFRRAEPQGPGEAAFVVADDGDGFDSDGATGLFQPFRRMHGRDEFPGTGVGLATVQRLLARHRGRVWAQSRPGEGARFFFALPLPGQPGGGPDV